uniref:TIR domain-containing protein n=1 Tax=Sphenodon punctatus TaxID=8508 RepID=A0A8D0GP75_SPHPU
WGDKRWGGPLVCGPVARCSSVRSIARYSFCNLSHVPLVPNDTTWLQLNFNSIRRVNATSFPLLVHLIILELGSQTDPVVIGNAAFRNLPNLKQLDLADNKMLTLAPDAFVGLSHIHSLRLYSNGLDQSILESDYLRDMISLEYLDLFGNKITRLRPHSLFYRLTSLQIVNLKLNQISMICEGDLNSFQGKLFLLFILNSNSLYSRTPVDFNRCGNPFKNINIDTLDLGGNGWTVDIMQQFFTAIKGTPILFLKLPHHLMGPGFGFHNLRDPDNNTFAGLTGSGLGLLDISYGFIFSLSHHLFQNMKDFKLLDVNHNKINQIQKEAFSGLESLKHLNLSYNLLGELYSYTFAGLHNVTTIALQENHIGAISGNPFIYLTKLELVDLRENALKIIPSFLHLSTVFLGGNRLVSIDKFGVSAVNLDLERNRLTNLGDVYHLLQVPDLKYLFLKQNRLSDCSKETNVSKGINVTEKSQLTYLDLGENMLKLVWERDLCLHVFSALSKLVVLHLNNNYLSFLPRNIFSGLTSLNRLNLASNLLSYISHGDFPASLKKLDLSGNQLLHPDPELFATLSFLDITFNRFYCDCDLSGLIVWLNQTNVTLAGPQDNMFCVAPPDFAGVALHIISTVQCNEDEVLKPLQFSLFIFTTVALIMLLSAVIIFTHFRGNCFILYKTVTRALLKEAQQEADTKPCKYDVYLCYSNKDFEWVQKSLIKYLDTQYSDRNRFTLCFEERDFLPGEEHIINIRSAIWNSRKTICVVTRQFLKDGWYLKDVLIMVVAGSLSQYQLMNYKPIRVFVQRSQYLRWPEDHQDRDWFLDKLSHQILKEKKVRKESRGLELQNVMTVS